MKTKIKSLISVVALCCIIFLLNPQRVSAQSSDKIAKAMIAANRPGEAYSITVEGSRGKGILQLESTAYGLLGNTDTKELGEKGWAQPWHDQLDRLHVSTRDGLTDVIAILACRGLVINGKITRDRFTSYVSRLKTMTPEMVQRWRTSSIHIQPNVSNLVLVGLLVAHDSLFAGSDSLSLAVREQRELKRFQSIPPDDIKAWATALTRKFKPEYTGQTEPYGWSGTPPTIDIAFELLSINSLFVNDIFQHSTFEVAILRAKELLGAVSTKQSNQTKTPATTQPTTVKPEKEFPELIYNLLDSTSLAENTSTIILLETDTFLITTTKKMFIDDYEKSIKKSTYKPDQELLKLFIDDTSAIINAKNLVKNFPRTNLSFRTADLLEKGQCLVYNKVKRRLEKKVKAQWYNTKSYGGKRLKTVDNYLLLETIERYYSYLPESN